MRYAKEIKEYKEAELELRQLKSILAEEFTDKQEEKVNDFFADIYFPAFKNIIYIIKSVYDVCYATARELLENDEAKVLNLLGEIKK